MIALDTTVFAYASGGEHPFLEPCRHLLDAIGVGQVSATTTVEVLQEFAHVHARRRGRPEARERVIDVLPSLRPLIVTNESDLTAGLELWRRHDRLGCFDSVLAAAALRVGLALVSTDKAFARVRGLDHVVPDQRGVKRLIAG